MKDFPQDYLKKFKSTTHQKVDGAGDTQIVGLLGYIIPHDYSTTLKVYVSDLNLRKAKAIASRLPKLTDLDWNDGGFSALFPESYLPKVAVQIKAKKRRMRTMSDEHKKAMADGRARAVTNI